MSLHIPYASGSFFDFHGVENLGAWASKMSNNIADEVGKGWLTVGATLAAALVIGAITYAINTSSDVATLKAQMQYVIQVQASTQSDVRQIRDGQDQALRALGVNSDRTRTNQPDR